MSTECIFSTYLRANAIGPDGAAAMAEALDDDGCGLETLSLAQNALGAEGFAAIAGCLKGNTSLTKLDLASNDAVDALGPLATSLKVRHACTF